MTKVPFRIWWLVRMSLWSFSRNPIKRWPVKAVQLVTRYCQGARRIKTTGDTIGYYGAPGVSVNFGGACPVQGYGEIDDLWCYYRSRGEGWEFEVYDVEPNELDVLPEAIWDYGERPYFWPQGGWVPADESCRNIDKAVKLFREWRTRRVTGGERR